MANAKYFLKRFAMALLTIFLVAGLSGMELLQTAMRYHLGEFGVIFIAATLFMFSFSCILKIFCMVTLACP